MNWTATTTNRKLQDSKVKYRFRISAGDRERLSEFIGKSITVELPSNGGLQHATVNVSPNFLTTCPEFYSAEIHAWLKDSEYVPWSPGSPPKFEVERVGPGVFRVGEKVN